MRKLLLSPEDRRCLLREAALLAKCAAVPHVLKHRAFFEEPNFFYLVTDCPHAELVAYLCSREKAYTEEDAREAMSGLVAALVGLEALGIEHRDVRPENVLMKGPSMGTIVLSGFGLAFKSSAGGGSGGGGGCGSGGSGSGGSGSGGSGSGGSGNGNIRAGRSAATGNVAYTAPEVVKGLPLVGAGAADVWSLGCVAFLLLVGHDAFEGSQPASVLQRVARGRVDMRPDHWRGVSRRGAAFVRACLEPRPAARPRASALGGHPWLDSAALGSECEEDETAAADDAADPDAPRVSEGSRPMIHHRRPPAAPAAEAPAASGARPARPRAGRLVGAWERLQYYHGRRLKSSEAEGEALKEVGRAGLGGRSVDSLGRTEGERALPQEAEKARGSLVWLVFGASTTRPPLYFLRRA